MKRNGRFSLSLHVLGHLAAQPHRSLTSAEIAEHNGTHAGFVRRVLGLLRAGGLVASEKGHSGGWRLAKPPEEISLADVFDALGEQLVPSESGGESNPPECVIERTVAQDIDVALAAATEAMRANLKHRTIADLGKALSAGVGPDDTGSHH
ncbi:Rrf2 family transcriptional regulator [Cognatiyoonia sp. IB215446]|uniref:RrF2 family transcriptional regulator n=1 Tax=Cognatiyoonia sp. IB215446 TaxID=3097355 RepID=UPI002A0EFA98|nr:Rrf2 family transcriptional regulator [Cognatiyoonia sp. IB215446]MDX8350456.1 Rrf2 family transcriptional regulator [Cognatiyoonia sp. IB215446]